ncbi:uncharacterized protein LOC123010909 [Tribolium madens]|uniref:uncharacterized protein LOC123010909 n=1 Tax=Tribolium madens TaxID=41895 RepID=UPI001CF721EC|nr:uncharacterized protein LOC123010909 [Tribolium madens]
MLVDGVEAFPSEEAVPQHFADQDDSSVERKLETDLATSELSSCFDDKHNFDLTKYINENVSVENRKVRSVGKKIDKQAQKYIIEDKNDNLDTNDDVDVETVFEGASLPVLEANDAFSLLEQFEASEKPRLPNTKCNENLSSDFGFSSSLVNNLEMDANQISSSSIEIFDKIPKAPINIFEEDVSLFEKDLETVKGEPQSGSIEKKDFNKQEQEKSRNEEVTTKQETKITKPHTAELNISHNYTKNKQILDALPQELIARINESGKRKTITVIPPIPTKKRGTSRSVESVSIHRHKILKVGNGQVHFDHDYCATPSPYPKEPQKDSGFQSSEEDDRSIIRNQPTVKTPDGKLMVSLLKVNTIRGNNHNQKKKLNLEEYKKRRLINSNATSQSNSPASSTCSSPLPEDENLKRLKHQEKLMKMAADLLNTPAKSTKGDVILPTIIKPVVQNPPPQRIVVPQKITPPPDLEVKTYVSIGTNTDISSINCSKTILASTQQLEEIKPLLQKVSDKINSNSFITSLIENIPKVKTRTTAFVKSENQEVIREDKIIHYLKKDREPVKTVNVGLQTDFDEEVNDDVESRYRRRIDKSPSVSSGGSSRSRQRRRRSSSSSSRSSHSSFSSSSSTSFRSSRSRSRSISPKRQRQYSAERLREVEERRVIYVGRISKGTTKEDLRRRFITFGPITNVSLHFRDYGDNYGFVTFANKEDAYEAVEHGNDGHVYPKYDLSFGGRRIFCKTSYSDLDNMRDDDYNYYTSRAPENSFDALLRAAQEKIRKRKP